MANIHSSIDWENIESKLVVDWGVSIDAIEVAKDMAKLIACEPGYEGMTLEQIAFPQLIKTCTGYTFPEWLEESRFF